MSVAQNRVLYTGSEFEEIHEQAVENGELIFERGFAVLSENGCGGKELSEALAASGAFEDLESVAAAFGSFFDVHFEGQAGATFGELRGLKAFLRWAISFLFEDTFDVRLRERGEMKLHAAGDDGRKQRIR